MTENKQKPEMIDDQALDAAAGGANTYRGTTTVSEGVLTATATPTRSGGDVSGDGTADVIVGAGPGGGPHVR